MSRVGTLDFGEDGEIRQPGWPADAPLRWAPEDEQEVCECSPGRFGLCSRCLARAGEPSANARPTPSSEPSPTAAQQTTSPEEPQ